MLAEMRIMDKNEIINSQKLKEETEKEFGTKIIESNSGSTRYSSRDKSYSNLIDFFIKVSKRDRRQHISIPTLIGTMGFPHTTWNLYVMESSTNMRSTL